MRRLLLIDGDYLAFKAAIAVEVPIEWEPGCWTWHTDFDLVKQAIEHQIEALMDELNADHYNMILSDSKKNFRHGVLPSYKANRKNIKRPLVLKAVRQWLIDEHEAIIYPELEGDDTIGILSTDPHYYSGYHKVIVGIDKDMPTIPGTFYRLGTKELIEVSKKDADDHHLIQTLTGDAVDGYSGCPGVGLESAKKIVKGNPLTVLVPYGHVFKTGKRKGEMETRYSEEPTTSKWEAVLSRFKKAGFSESYALQQARVARILRHTDWDSTSRKVKLWRPYD